MRCLHLGMLMTFIFNGAAAAADWPQWLGPNRDGSTTEKVAPWKGELKEVWRKPVGEGNSAPVVVGGLVYLHTKVKDEKAEMLQAFDAKSGEVKWEKKYEKSVRKTAYGQGPRATPCVAGDRIFTFGNTGVLTCWNAADGKIVWQKNTLEEFKEPNLFFAVACSPIVVDNKVMVMLGKGTTGVVAFDVKDGAVAWKAGGDPASYSSPIVFGEGAKRQIIFLTGDDVLGLSPGGDIYWKHLFKDTLNESSTTPVKMNDILVVSSITTGAIGLKLTEKDGKPAAAQAWKNTDLTSYFSTPVVVDKDHFYMVTGNLSPNPSATLRCVDSTSGKEVWSKPKIAKYHASFVRLGDGNLLLLDDSGNLMMLAPDLKEYKELARAKVCGKTWVHAAIANGYLYVRDNKSSEKDKEVDELICYKLAGGE